MIAVGVRRMHDVGKSAWYIIVPIYNLVLWARPGEEGPINSGRIRKRPKMLR